MKYNITFLLTFSTLFALAQANSFRQIYLFAPHAKDSNLVKQQQFLASDTEGVKERDLRVMVIVSESKNSTLLKRYKIMPDKFTFVLIGKDGGEKFRSSKTVELQRLFSLIDGMPMRKDEMRQRN